jgi:hypothetical protein
MLKDGLPAPPCLPEVSATRSSEASEKAAHGPWACPDRLKACGGDGKRPSRGVIPDDDRCSNNRRFPSIPDHERRRAGRPPASPPAAGPASKPPIAPPAGSSRSSSLLTICAGDVVGGNWSGGVALLDPVCVCSWMRTRRTRALPHVRPRMDCRHYGKHWRMTPTSPAARIDQATEVGRGSREK